MSSPQRKANTAAFTSALKQVFYIHKNIVAELCAQLDVVTDECKLLKGNSHISKSSGKCESCIHLEKMNRSLQEHFNSLLHEKDTGIKTLERKIQALIGRANIVNLQAQKGKMLPKELASTVAKQDLLLVRDQAFSPKKSDSRQHPSNSNDVHAPLLDPCSQGEVASLSEAELVKGHSKLRLTRHGKRHSHYVEEPRETKRVKVSPGAAAKSNSISDHKLGSGLNEIFVADTVCNFKATLKTVDSGFDNEQSQEILVVPETLAIDNSSNSGCEHEAELEKQNDSDDDSKEAVVCTERNYHLESVGGFLDISGGNDNGSIQTENNTLVNDDDDILNVGNSDADNTCVIPGRKQAESKTLLSNEPMRKSFFQGEGSCERAFQQSSGNWQGNSGEAVKIKGPLRNSINVKDVKEHKLNVNDATFVNEGLVNEGLVNEGSEHHSDVITGNTSGSISTFKQNCHMLRKNSSVFVRNTTNQKEPENAISDPTMNSLNRNHNEGIMKENLTSKSMRRTTLSQSFTDKNGLIDTFKTGSKQRQVVVPNIEGEKLQIAEAIRRSLKDFHNISHSERSEDTHLESNFQVPMSSPELASVKIKYARKCSSTNEGKDIARNRLQNSADVAKCLPLSLQAPPELRNKEHEEISDTIKLIKYRKQLLHSVDANLKDDKIANLAAPEPNGSLNPEIHLTEYLNSEMTEKQKANQIFCALDETIAPNLISQYIVGSQQNQNLSQITELNTETNRSIQVQQNDNKLQVTPKDDWLKDDDESILNNNVVSDDDDPETIKPSPQQRFQSRSQLHCSIPASSSSYKFIHKKPQLATKSVLQGIGESKIMNNEDSVMDVSKHLLHDNSDMDLDQSTVLHLIHNPPPQTMLDSFDRVPKSEETEFPHVSVVRKRSERSKLEGFSCKQCYEYYKNSGLSEEALQQKKNECSRHRERYRPPETPEHFWSLGFPDTAEMIERGQKYDSKESPLAAYKAPRRRQRLEKKF